MESVPDIADAPPISDPPVSDGPADLKPRRSYFGAGKSWRVSLDDGQYIVHTKFMEGAKNQYLNATNRDLAISQVSREARMKLAPGDDRRALLKAAITDWCLYAEDGVTPVAYNAMNLELMLKTFDTEVMDLVYKDVQKHNPWLLADVTVEKIDEQIAELTLLRSQKVEEEAGKAPSAS